MEFSKVSNRVRRQFGHNLGKCPSLHSLQSLCDTLSSGSDDKNIRRPRPASLLITTQAAVEPSPTSVTTPGASASQGSMVAARSRLPSLLVNDSQSADVLPHNMDARSNSTDSTQPSNLDALRQPVTPSHIVPVQADPALMLSSEHSVVGCVKPDANAFVIGFSMSADSKMASDSDADSSASSMSDNDAMQFGGTDSDQYSDDSDSDSSLSSMVIRRVDTPIEPKLSGKQSSRQSATDRRLKSVSVAEDILGITLAHKYAHRWQQHAHLTPEHLLDREHHVPPIPHVVSALNRVQIQR